MVDMEVNFGEEGDQFSSLFPSSFRGKRFEMVARKWRVKWKNSKIGAGIGRGGESETGCEQSIDL